MKIAFFRKPADFRKWLGKNHAAADELWIGFYKKGSGKASITWPESVDEALCFGWIDGIRKSVDDVSYKIRFTPRRRGSIWSAINIRRVAALTDEGRMRPAGEKAFAVRRENKSGIYSYEQRPTGIAGAVQERSKKEQSSVGFFRGATALLSKGSWLVDCQRKEGRDTDGAAQETD